MNGSQAISHPGTIMSKRKPLTEKQWLTATASDPLLKYLQQHCRIAKVAGGKRKLRLFSVACCRVCTITICTSCPTPHRSIR